LAERSIVVGHDLPGIEDSYVALARWIREQGYKGYDPFDALRSPIFRLPFLRSAKLPRLAAQQVMKRLPMNVRRLLGIPKGLNPVTLGLCLQAATYRSAAGRCDQAPAGEMEWLLDQIARARSPGFSGVCWGYDFDWEARYARIPAYAPTVVATGFVSNALFEHYRITGSAQARDLCLGAAQFVRKDLNRTADGTSFCYSYSPYDRQVVYNATMKGARLLAQAYAITGDRELLAEAGATVAFVMARQRPDGAWAYAQGDVRTWVDNFHTGYVLDSLDEYMRLTGDRKHEEQLHKGLDYYLGNFFEQGVIPKYYDNSVYPVDATAMAQSIITLSRFDRLDRANAVARWCIGNMQDPKGYFYYQKHRGFTNRIPYMRWSNAWMLLALACLDYRSQLAREGSPIPLRSAAAAPGP
jgi:hypothetical protein